MEYFTTKNKFVEIRATERSPRHPLLRLGDAPKPGGRWASRPKSLTSPRDVTCPALRFRVKAAAVSNAEAFSGTRFRKLNSAAAGLAPSAGRQRARCAVTARGAEGSEDAGRASWHVVAFQRPGRPPPPPAPRRGHAAAVGKVSVML